MNKIQQLERLIELHEQAKFIVCAEKDEKIHVFREIVKGLKSQEQRAA
ncbi:hypothetical protein ACFL0M_14470 [Thermodesulfobacteriota bacterium]